MSKSIGGDVVKRKGFECESSARDFASKVNGVVKFSPLPDYMSMISYWVVEYVGDEVDNERKEKV